MSCRRVDDQTGRRAVQHGIQSMSLSGEILKSGMTHCGRKSSRMRAKIDELSAGRHPECARKILKMRFAVRKIRAILFLARPFHRVPIRVRHIGEVIELARAVDPFAAVNYDALTVHVS